MNIPVYPILAHGALGWWDDLIFLAIITLFIGMMVYSWFRSRSDDFADTDLMPPPTASPSDERFELE